MTYQSTHLSYQTPEAIVLRLADTFRLQYRRIDNTAIFVLDWEVVDPLTLENMDLEAIIRNKAPVPQAAKRSDRLANQRCWTGDASYIGVIPYEQFTDLPEQGAGPYFAHRIELALICDTEKQTLALQYSTNTNEQQRREVLQALENPPQKLEHTVYQGKLAPRTTEDDYLDHLHRILHDIREGRYYQLNYLRYFQLCPTATKKFWLRDIIRNGGPHSCWQEHGNHIIASYTPERLIRITVDSANYCKAYVEPIKGTAPRDQDPIQDNANKEQLLASAKDRAELAMIVDLMRNDLFKLTPPQGVQVSNPLRCESFRNVHHLIATIEAKLPYNTRLNDIYRALLPAGSITGAPKIEVIRAIRELEGRSRQAIMGNGFYIDADRGFFELSVLIRTCHYRPQDKQWHVAFGSGIVVASDPHQELAETYHKASIVYGEPAP